MLPNPQHFSSSSNANMGNFTSSGYSSVQTFPNQQAQGFPTGQTQGFQNQQAAFLPGESLHQGTDPNSPAAFQHNIQRAQEQVARLQNQARAALAGIQNSYHPGNSPAQTEANLAALKETIPTVSSLLSQTGVGALPLLPIPGPGETIMPPTEEQMIAEANRSIHRIYEELQKRQDSAVVAANILGASDRGNK